MGKYIDLVGQTIGHAKILSKASTRGEKSGKLITKFICQCDCGNEFTRTSQQIRSMGENLCCGKCRPTCYHGKDLTGQRFGKLTVLYYDEERRLSDFNSGKTIKPYWVCQCDCGNIISVRTDELVSSIVKSCGCYHKEISSVLSSQNCKHNEYETIGDITYIRLANSKEPVIIDTEDINKVQNFYWYLQPDGRVYGYVRGSKNKFINISNIILERPDEDLIVDHIEHNTLDNRKNKIRICTTNNNNANQSRCSDAGISKRKNGWHVTIHYNNQTINLGIFKTYEEALDIRRKAEDVFFGKYAYKNSIGEKDEN